MSYFTTPRRVFTEGSLSIHDTRLDIKMVTGSVDALSFNDIRERGALMLSRAFSLSDASARGVSFNSLKRGVVSVEQVLPCGRRIHIFDETDDVRWDVPDLTFRFSQSVQTDACFDTASFSTNNSANLEGSYGSPTVDFHHSSPSSQLSPTQPSHVLRQSNGVAEAQENLGVKSYDIRGILNSKKYGQKRLLEKYDTCNEGVPLSVQEFGQIKTVLAVYLLAECDKKDHPQRQDEVKPFCEAIVKTFPKQGFALNYLFNDSFTGKFDYALKNQKQKPGHDRHSYESKNKRQKRIFLQLSAEEKATTDQKLIALRSVVPAPATIEQIKTLHHETTKYRRNFLKDGQNAQNALSTFPRLADTPDLLLMDLTFEHGVTVADLDQFLVNWDNWVTKILITAVKKRPTAILTYRDDPALDSLARAKHYLEVDPSLRSEAAFKVLPFLLPSGSALKKMRTKDVIRKLMLSFQKTTFDEILLRIQHRAENLRATGEMMSPVLVKYDQCTGTSFYVALDGQLLETHGNLAKAIALLMATFATFWCQYPVELKSVYRFLEHALGFNKGLGVTPSLAETMKEIQDAQCLAKWPSDLNDNSL